MKTGQVDSKDHPDDMGKIGGVEGSKKCWEKVVKICVLMRVTVLSTNNELDNLMRKEDIFGSQFLDYRSSPTNNLGMLLSIKEEWNKIVLIKETRNETQLERISTVLNGKNGERIRE